MAKTKTAKDPVKLNRRVTKERRDEDDRRKESAPVASERRKVDRRKVQRRRQIDPTTCERDYSQEEIEFMQALDEYKRANGRMFPTCSEILEVVRKLGYVQAGTNGVPAEAGSLAETQAAEAEILERNRHADDEDDFA